MANERTAKNRDNRTALYRFYDVREALLYVGITKDPWRRWGEHMRKQPWYPQIKHYAVTMYDARPLAEKAETRAIRAEGPRFNIAGALRPPAARIQGKVGTVAGVALALWVAAMALVPVTIAIGHFSPVALAVVALMFGSMVTWWIFLVIIAAPWIASFALWLDRNFDLSVRGSR
jgi:hypothetical protein